MLPADHGPGDSGLAYIRPDSDAKLTFPLYFLVRGVCFTFGASALFALMPAVVAHRLQLPTSFYSLLLSCMGLGAVLAAVLLPRLNRRLSIDWRVTLATGAFAVGLLGLGFADNRWLLYGLLTLVGMAWMLVLNSFSVGVQTVVPRWVQARTISLYLLTIQGGMALGSVTWGTVAEHGGLPLALTGAAGWLGLSMLLGRWFSLHTPPDTQRVGPGNLAVGYPRLPALHFLRFVGRLREAEHLPPPKLRESLTTAPTRQCVPPTTGRRPGYAT